MSIPARPYRETHRDLQTGLFESLQKGHEMLLTFFRDYGTHMLGCAVATNPEAPCECGWTDIAEWLQLDQEIP